VSKNDNCHCAGTTKVVIKYGKVCLKRKALSCPQKTKIEGVDVTCWDRLFQVWVVAKGRRWTAMYDWPSAMEIIYKAFWVA